ncbi:DUF6415 family natural product biosynthesis protein [Streptomyces sp. NPDC018059]|uniref:DUF6415 family natural product biosynthesis protein n=1 Tax=Streptomyces sp. NPDC018059 TaxID=3365041 RepID=UPI0037A540A0
MTTHSAPTVPDVFHEASPLDREPYLSLVKAVLAWSVSDTVLRPRDCEQIALQLSGQAGVLAEDLRRRCTRLPEISTLRTLTEISLGEAERRLSAPPRLSVAGVQNLARLVRALYERHDQLHAAARPDRTAEIAR